MQKIGSGACLVCRRGCINFSPLAGIGGLFDRPLFLVRAREAAWVAYALYTGGSLCPGETWVVHAARDGTIAARDLVVELTPR